MWRQVFQYGARGYPWTKGALDRIVQNLKARSPRLQLLKTAQRTTLQRGGEVVGEPEEVDAVAARADIVGFYFSASWCGPCRNFTPRLARAYRRLRAAGERFEVVFISADRDKAPFDAYFAEMPWLALPFSEKDLNTDLKALFDIHGIPALVLLRSSDGKVVKMDGRSVIEDGVDWPFTKLTFMEMCDAGDA